MAGHPLGRTAHTDTFTRDNLPPSQQWPQIPLDGFAYPLLHQNEIGNRDLVIRIDVSSQRTKRAVGHSHRDCGHYR